jgi:hypothetical protein
VLILDIIHVNGAQHFDGAQYRAALNEAPDGIAPSVNNASNSTGRPQMKVWRRRHRAVAFVLGSAAMLLLPALLHETDGSRHSGTSIGGASDEFLPPIARLRSVEHLIVVAGHAVYTASDRSNGQVQREASWFLEPFQKGERRVRQHQSPYFRPTVQRQTDTLHPGTATACVMR